VERLGEANGASRGEGGGVLRHCCAGRVARWFRHGSGQATGLSSDAPPPYPARPRSEGLSDPILYELVVGRADRAVPHLVRHPVQRLARHDCGGLSDLRAQLLPCLQEGFALPSLDERAQPLQPRFLLRRAGQAPRAVCAAELRTR
jgi:hypothetical protein